MFWHVYQRAAKSPFLEKTVLATDDSRIYEAAREYDIPVVMTAGHHRSGTDRLVEAAATLGLGPESVVVNVQGDEPLLATEMIDELLGPFDREEVCVSTLARRLDPADAERPDLVKVVLDRMGRAMYFSRSQVPFRNRDQQPPEYWVHVGVYAYRYQTLQRFHALKPGRLEQAEKLEQLRLLENGIPIHVVPTAHISHGVDRPEDLAAVEQRMIQEQAQ